MFKHVEYTPEGVCSQKITFDLVDGYVHHVQFTGGCAGNTKGVAILSEGPGYGAAAEGDPLPRSQLLPPSAGTGY